MSQRPTCGTCPYWNESVPRKGTGVCQRHAPLLLAKHECESDWAFTGNSEWCGEHPDFQAYIDSRLVSAGESVEGGEKAD